MCRLLQVRLLFVLIALSLVPTLALPFAERLRSEWTKYWEPKPKEFDWAAFDPDAHVLVNGIYLCPTDWSNARTLDSAEGVTSFDPELIDGFTPTLGPHPLMEGVGEIRRDGSSDSSVSESPVENDEH